MIIKKHPWCADTDSVYLCISVHEMRMALGQKHNVFARLGQEKARGRYLWLMRCVIFFFHTYIIQAQEFKQINTQTRLDIAALQGTADGGIFFMTNAIFTFDSGGRVVPALASAIKAGTFWAVSSREIWHSRMLETYVSELYHRHHGKTEELKSPFANYITAIVFDSAGKSGLFASWSEVAAFHGSSFTFYPPVPTSFSVEKLTMMSRYEFMALTHTGELFHYHDGRYEQVQAEKKVVDFALDKHGSLFYLTEQSLIQRKEGRSVAIAKSHDFAQAKALAVVSDDKQLVVGLNGMVMTVDHGQVSRLRVNPKVDFTAVMVRGQEIWIAGKGGCLLYSGKKNYEPALAGEGGFTSHRLISTGIYTNNEYGVAMGDVNGDQLPDLYAVCLSGPNRLYINKSLQGSGQPRFSEEAFGRGATGETADGDNASMRFYKLGTAMADVDNDGDQDLYVCHLTGNNQMFLNNGKGHFRSVAHQSGRACEDLHRSNAAIFADVDCDGDSDLFVANEEGSNKLFSNDGTGHFVDVTPSSGLETKKGGMCAAFADVNHDGMPDLAVTFWFPGDKIYLNRSTTGQIRFEDITHTTGLSHSGPAKSNGIAFADVNNDGHSDLFIARRNAVNSLYLNPGNGQFTDQSAAFFSSRQALLSNGLLFEDLDLDGYVDLYLSNVGRNLFYKNEQGKRFTEMTAVYGLENEGYGTGLCTGDIDHDFDPDVYASNYLGGNSMLFLNQTKNLLAVKFRFRGLASNRDGIGTKLWLFEENERQPVMVSYRELSSGSGYGSASNKEMILAVDPHKKYVARIKFPCTADTLTIPDIVAGKLVVVDESVGLKRMMASSLLMVKRYLTDREMQPELLKYVLIICLLSIYLCWQRKRNSPAAFRYHLVAAPLITLVFVAVNQLNVFAEAPILFYVGPFTALLFWLLTHFLIQALLHQQLIRKQRTELRERIARDLHDDLASTLSSVAIYAGSLPHHAMNDTGRQAYLAEKIANLSQQALRAITEIIWMTAPRNDTLQSLVTKTANDMQELFAEHRMLFRFVSNLNPQPIVLNESVRTNIFLILKEAVNNIVKHSEAQAVDFVAHMEGRHCTITLTDHGKGMNESQVEAENMHGHGLANMRCRAQESNLGFAMHSIPGEGTKIQLHVKI